MPDVEYLHGAAVDGEQDAIDMWLSTVEKLTQFNGRIGILRCHVAAGGKVRQGGDCCSESSEPALSRVSRLARVEPVVYGGNIAFGLIG